MTAPRLERAIARHHEHRRSRSLAALREAVELLRGAVRDTAPGTEDHAVAAASLGLVLRDLGIATQDDRAQDGAVEWMRVALATGPPALASTMENNLAVALRDRYDRNGHLPDLVDAIALLRRSATAAHPRLRAQALNNLGLALRMRHRRDGDLSYLDEAVLAHRLAVEVTVERDPELPRHLNDLASALRARAGDEPGDALLDEAIDLHRRALAALAPDAPLRRVCLHDLFTALLARGKSDDLLLEVDRELRALLAAEGTALIAAELNRRVTLLLRHGGRETATPGRVDDDLVDAVDDLRRAVDLVAQGIPERAQLRANLADCLRGRHERRPAAVTVDVVTGAYRDACREGLQAGADSTVRAAMRWAGWAERRNDPDARAEAVEAYGYALEALYRMLALQSGEARKGVRLRQLGGVPARAALACLQARSDHPAGTAERAVTLLERGRAIALSEAIDLDRARLADLAATEHHDLAERFRSITAFLREKEGTGTRGGGAR